MCLLSESGAVPLLMKAVLGSIVLVIALAGVGIRAWRRRPRGERHVEGSEGATDCRSYSSTSFLFCTCHSKLHLGMGWASLCDHKRTWNTSPATQGTHTRVKLARRVVCFIGDVTLDIKRGVHLLSRWTVLEAGSEKTEWSWFVFFQTRSLLFITIDFLFCPLFWDGSKFSHLTNIFLPQSSERPFLLNSSFNTWNVEESTWKRRLRGRRNGRDIGSWYLGGKIHSFSKYVWSTYYVPGSVLDSGM